MSKNFPYSKVSLCRDTPTWPKIKVVLQVSHRYFFEVKVETVKLMQERDDFWLYMSAQIKQATFTNIIAIWTCWGSL